MPADEPRRSVRATRGQHSKIDLDQAPPPKQAKAAKKGKKAQKVQAKQREEEEEEEEDGPMRCICGATTEDPDDEQPWIACDTCHAWQHNVCMSISEWEEEQPEQYFCEQCKPENHKELLAATAKGQKPWLTRHAKYLVRKGEEEDKKREEEEKKREAVEKKKRGKKGKRVSDQSSRRSRGADATPAATPEPKPETQELKPVHKSVPRPEPKSAKKEREKIKLKDKKEPEREVEKKEHKKEVAKKEPEKEVAKKEPKKEVAKKEPKKEVAKKEPEQEVEKKEPEKEVEKKEPEKEKDKEKPTPKPKSQKRREPPQYVEAKGPEPKLRKGSEGQALPASPVETQAPVILSLAEDRQGPAKALTKTMIHCMRASTAVRLDGPSSQARAEKLAVDIEAAVYNSHPNHNSYAQQCRALNHNLKHNQDLYDRLLRGELTPEALSTMTSAEMQTKEQQLKDAEMRARAAKQATLSDEHTGPRIKRTHKGDELVDDDDVVMDDAPSNTFRRPSAKDKDAQPQPLQVDTQHARKGSDYDFKKVMSSVSPTSASYRRQTQQQQGGPGEDADVDRMLGESPPYSPVADKDPDKIWEGKIMMQSLADYFADAKWAAGVDPTQSVGVKWEQLIPHEMTVAGRIDNPVANTYLCSLRYSSHDVCVISLHPSYPAGKEHHQAIIDYLLSKNRFAVISNRPTHNDVLTIVDMYLAACPAGSGDPFEFILNLADSVIPKDRPEPLLIAVLVLEQGPQAAARKAMMMATAGGGTGSDGGVAAPHQQLPAPNGGPLPDLANKGPTDAAKEAQRQLQQLGEQAAREILGPELYSTPTLTFLLPLAYRMHRSEWEVIKSIYETDHRAREDLTQLNAAIEMRAKEKT